MLGDGNDCGFPGSLRTLSAFPKSPNSTASTACVAFCSLIFRAERDLMRSRGGTMAATEAGGGSGGRMGIRRQRRDSPAARGHAVPRRGAVPVLLPREEPAGGRHRLRGDARLDRLPALPAARRRRHRQSARARRPPQDRGRARARHLAERALPARHALPRLQRDRGPAHRLRRHQPAHRLGAPVPQLPLRAAQPRLRVGLRLPRLSGRELSPSPTRSSAIRRAAAKTGCSSAAARPTPARRSSIR